MAAGMRDYGFTVRSRQPRHVVSPTVLQQVRADYISELHLGFYRGNMGYTGNKDVREKSNEEIGISG